MPKGGRKTDRNTLITACDRSLRLLRAEAGLTQDDMARELGISKKTLIGIEKGRSSLGWTGSAALCLLFGDSPTLRRELSGDPRRTAAELRGHAQSAPTPAEEEIAFPDPPAAEAPPASSPLWRTVAQLGRFTAEQNIISEHYRLLDASGRRVFAAFDYPEVAAEADRLTKAAKSDSSGGNYGDNTNQ